MSSKVRHGRSDDANRGKKESYPGSPYVAPRPPLVGKTIRNRVADELPEDITRRIADLAVDAAALEEQLADRPRARATIRHMQEVLASLSELASPTGDRSSHSSAKGDRGDLPLTPRQLEVLRLLALGNSAKEIAGKLNISPRTAEFHKYRMMRNLRISTTAGLIRYAMNHGLVPL